MFDWDDQELANIIWGESSEADEQTVHYPEDTKNKDLPNYEDNNVKRKLSVRNGNVKASEEDASSSKSSSDGAKRTRLDFGLESSQNQLEDKNLSELVGNNWANIGGFDDLDRIFSTDNIDGQTSLGDRDDLWSTSKDPVTQTSWEFDAFRSTAAHFDINSDYIVDENHSIIPSFRKEDDISSYSGYNFGEFMQQKEEYDVTTKGLINKKTTLGMTAKTSLDSQIAAEEAATSNKSGDKEYWSSNESKSFHKTGKLTGSKLVGELYDSYPSPAGLVPQFPTTVQNYVSSFPNQEQLRRGIAHRHQQSMILLNRPMEISAKPVKMTPREKIEKLRKRQQMRAMLAIQLQQQQLGNRVLNMEKAEFGDDEGISTVPCRDRDSPKKMDGSSVISDIDDYSVEDKVVYQLQDIVARLDLKVRLCIRDSLYRLARNSTQRSYTSDHASTKEQSSSHDSAHLEAETNHIDRVIAHLLFHRPFKPSSKNTETPESSTSTKISIEQKTSCPNSMAMSFLTKGPEDEYNLSPRDPKTSCTTETGEIV